MAKRPNQLTPDNIKVAKFFTYGLFSLVLLILAALSVKLVLWILGIEL